VLGLQVMEHEGIAAFYTSYRTTLVMNVPFTAVHFATYEAAKKALGQLGEEEGKRVRITLRRTWWRGAAGALASAATNPLDVVKTRLQCQVTWGTLLGGLKFEVWGLRFRVWGLGFRLQSRLRVEGCGLRAAGSSTIPVWFCLLWCLACSCPQGVCGSRRFQSGSVLGAMRSLVAEEGPRVLWRGVAARVMFHTPAAAICWSTYEACKTFLKGQGSA